MSLFPLTWPLNNFQIFLTNSLISQGLDRFVKELVTPLSHGIGEAWHNKLLQISLETIVDRLSFHSSILVSCAPPELYHG